MLCKLFPLNRQYLFSTTISSRSNTYQLMFICTQVQEGSRILFSAYLLVIVSVFNLQATFFINFRSLLQLPILEKEMSYDYEWNPCGQLANTSNINYGVIILNTPINLSFNTGFVLKLWNNAKVRLTVDGGTRRWVNWLNENKYDIEAVLAPDLITGDMDSTPRDVLEIFDTKNTKIVKTPDQSHTDFTKSLMALQEHIKNENISIDTVFVLADTCGRLDQIMGNISTLYRAKEIIPNIAIFQIATNSISWVLWEGSHKIHIPNNLIEKKEWCALLPIRSPCRLTTTGLKWNLDDDVLQFGKMVSSSNTYDNSPIVTVNTKNPVIWSMGINSLL